MESRLPDQYRPDIDGLRAISMLAVLFYHLDFEQVRGGFVGVDVFFVISGFLITRLILRDVAAGKFSLRAFYIRRVRRLGPALVVTILLSCVASLLLLAPEHLVRFGGSAVATVLSVSNFYFWQEAGYFDASAIVKPLLHTWSLSVEEQFYLVWPALLFALAAWRAWAPLAFIAVAGIASLIVGEQWLRIDRSAAFYLTPFRVVEFAFGALMVWGVRYQPRRTLLLEPIALAGLALVAYAACTYTRNTPVPGLAAIVPSLGAALLIYAGQARYAGRILNNPVAVGLGLISYSLYLVHWPIIVFFRYFEYAEPTLAERWVIAGVAVGIAALMYRFVERPFRSADASGWRVPSRRVIGGMGTAVAAVVVFGVAAMLSGGFPARVAAEASGDAELAAFEHSGVKPTVPEEADILLLGDSHADHFTEAMLWLGHRAGMKVARSIKPGCPPLFVESSFGSADDPVHRECLEQMAQWRQQVQSFGGRFIVLAARWSTLTAPSHYGRYRTKRHWLFVDPAHGNDVQGPQERFAAALRETLSAILAAGKRVIILGQVPETGADLNSCYNTPRYVVAPPEKRCLAVPSEEMIARVAFDDQLFRDVSREWAGRVTAWLPSEELCRSGVCARDLNGQLLYRNEDHITAAASLLLAKQMGALLEFLATATDDHAAREP